MKSAFLNNKHLLHINRSGEVRTRVIFHTPFYIKNKLCLDKKRNE